MAEGDAAGEEVFRLGRVGTIVALGVGSKDVGRWLPLPESVFGLTLGLDIHALRLAANKVNKAKTFPGCINYPPCIQVY
jgi:hypothetical protein